MTARKGIAPVQVVVLIALIIIVGVVGFMTFRQTGQITDENTTDAHPVEPGGDEPQQPQPQIYTVEEMTLNATLAPLGIPIEVTARIVKVQGEDPFNVELSVSGEAVEERQVVFGESDIAEEKFIVVIDRMGRYEVQIGGYRKGFEVREDPVRVEWLDVSPRQADPDEVIVVTFGARNPNGVPLATSVLIEAEPSSFYFPVELQSKEYREFSFNLTRQGPAEYHIRVEGMEQIFTINGEPDGGDADDSEMEFEWTPIEWEPDPITWNMTSKLPPGASPVRLSMPVPIDSLYGRQWVGIGGMGLHAGGHIEGLDHVWIESTTAEPVNSWGNGTVLWIEYSGDIENGEYHIGIDLGRNLTGVHMEVATPLVEVGDYVERGEPVGYGMVFFDGLQSAEYALVDRGRTDGIYNGGQGVLVSPFDYLVESERIALAEAYIENIIEPYMSSGKVNGMFEPAQPYFTNRLVIHREGRLHGEWLLVSQNWSSGHPNDLMTIIEAENPYYKGALIRGMDDESEGGVSYWNIKSDLQIDYENGRLWFTSWTGKKTYGIFQVDESGGRAVLVIEYQTGGYPTGFSENALTYTVRSYIPRRMDAVLLGVRDEQ